MKEVLTAILATGAGYAHFRLCVIFGWFWPIGLCRAYAPRAKELMARNIVVNESVAQRRAALLRDTIRWMGEIDDAERSVLKASKEVGPAPEGLIRLPDDLTKAQFLAAVKVVRYACEKYEGQPGLASLYVKRHIEDVVRRAG